MHSEKHVKYASDAKVAPTKKHNDIMSGTLKSYDCDVGEIKLRISKTRYWKPISWRAKYKPDALDKLVCKNNNAGLSKTNQYGILMTSTTKRK